MQFFCLKLQIHYALTACLAGSHYEMSLIKSWSYPIRLDNINFKVSDQCLLNHSVKM